MTEMNSLRLSATAIRWIGAAAAAAAFIGPPATYWLVRAENRATLDAQILARFEANEARIKALESGLDSLKSDLQRQSENLSNKMDRVLDRVNEVREAVSRINGKIGAEIPGRQSVLSDARNDP